MKTIIAIAALSLISNMAVAETFQYERQIASQDLDPNIPSLSEGISNPKISVGQPRVSLFETYRGNPDTEAGHAEPGSLPVTGGDHIYTGYDMLIDSNPDLEV